MENENLTATSPHIFPFLIVLFSKISSKKFLIRRKLKSYKLLPNSNAFIFFTFLCNKISFWKDVFFQVWAVTDEDMTKQHLKYQRLFINNSMTKFLATLVTRLDNAPLTSRKKLGENDITINPGSTTAAHCDCLSRKQP